MTICIAAIGRGANNKELIVFATDHMISSPQIGQFEMSVEKYKKINDTTVAMLSGNPLIFDSLIANCEECEFDEMTERIRDNMHQIKNDMIQKEILDMYHIDFDYLRGVLNTEMKNPFILKVFETISQFALKTNILLTGFKGDDAQIMEVNETSIRNMKDMNFDAIGSGAVQAIYTLLFQRHSPVDPLSATIYNVYKAKRNAEISVGVGKETDMMVLSKAGVVEIGEGKIEVLQQIYDGEFSYGKTHEKLNEVIEHLIT
jgi:hypothetical protein